MNKYAVEGVVGEGAYGVVLKCRNKVTNEIVAVKKFKECEEDDVVRKTTLREVKILRMLKNPCVVDLREAFRRKGKLYLVFEYMENNLLEVLEENPNGLDPETVRRYVFQLCLAIEFCHRHGVIHRDIKPENLLVNRAGQLKLCDFGFARTVAAGDVGNLTDYVATRWYRSPELLLGSNDYSFRIDVWAIGCIMAELLDGQPLFPGDSELDQLFVIQKTLGPLTSSQLDAFQRNSRFAGMKFPEIRKVDTFNKRFSRILSKKGLAFMKSVVQLEPDRRLSSRECVNHPYFEGLKEEFGVADDFAEPRPKSAAISGHSSGAAAVSALPIGAMSATSVAVKTAASPRHAARAVLSDTPTDAHTEDTSAPRSGRKGASKPKPLDARKMESSNTGPSPTITPAAKAAVRTTDVAKPVSLGTRASATGSSPAATPSTTAATSGAVVDAAKRASRLTSTRTASEDPDRDRSHSKEPAAKGSSRKITDKQKDALIKSRVMPLAKPSAASAAAYGGSVSTSARALDSEEPTYHRPPRIREDSDDFPIPVAASAHIHAAAARAVANGDDAAGADFDAVEHYVSTRPTSGIRPRSGVRTSAVNPALAAVRGPTVQAAPGSRKSPMAVVLSGRGDDDPHDFHSSSKLQEDEPAPPLSRLAASAAVVSVPQPTPVATASHSRRRHNTRPADPLPDVALPSVVPLPAATAITYNAESERLAKLADDGPPVSRASEKPSFRQSNFYVTPIPGFKK